MCLSGVQILVFVVPYMLLVPLQFSTGWRESQVLLALLPVDGAGAILHDSVRLPKRSPIACDRWIWRVLGNQDACRGLWDTCVL